MSLLLLAACGWMPPPAPVAVTPPPPPEVVPTDGPASRRLPDAWQGVVACGRTRLLARTGNRNGWLVARLPVDLAPLAAGPGTVTGELDVGGDEAFRVIENDEVDAENFCWRGSTLPPYGRPHLEGVGGTVHYELTVQDARPPRDSGWWWEDSGDVPRAWDLRNAEGVLVLTVSESLRLQHTESDELVDLLPTRIEVPWSWPYLR